MKKNGNGVATTKVAESGIDLELRVFSREGRLCVEVLKDRAAEQAAKVAAKTPETAAAEALEALARELIDHIGEIQNAWHWQNWRRKHARTLSVLLRELADGPTKRKLIAIGRAKKAQFTNFREREREARA